MGIVRFDNVQFSTGNSLAAEDVNALTRNARLLDALSYRGRRAITNAIIKYSYEWDATPTVVWRGTFQYRDPVTTLRIIAECPQPSGGTHTMKVYLNGVLRLSTAWIAARSTYSITINALGFSDLDFVDVEIRDDWVTADAEPIVLDCFLTTMAAAIGSYPGVPTFGAITQANLEQLMAAQQWVYDRLNITDQSLFMGPMLMVGNGYSTSYEALLYDGSIEYTNGATRLIIGYNYLITYNQSETIRVRLDAVQVATATYTLGQSGEGAFDIDISGYTVDASIRVTIVQTVNTLPTTRQIGSLYSIIDIFTKRASYTPPTLPSEYAPRQSLTFSALQTALTQIATATNDAETRIIGTSGAFDRQRVFRWRPGRNDEQNAYYKRLFVARGKRAHDALWIRGKGLSIEYGPATSNYNPDKLEWETRYKETLTDGDEIQTRLVYFDQFPGLDMGMPYFITGSEIYYAAEQCR